MGEYGNEWDKIIEKCEKDKNDWLKDNLSQGMKDDFILNEDNEELLVDCKNFDPNEKIEDSMLENEFFYPNEDFEVTDGLEENPNNLFEDHNHKNGDKEVKKFLGFQRIKNLIKDLDWEDIAEDWTIKYQRNQNQEETVIQLDPKQDSSETNPLYKHKAWLKKIYSDQSLNLNDTKIGEICNLHKSTIGRWRRIHKIPTKPSSTGRWVDNKGYIRMYLTEDYNHPELMSHRGEGKFIRFEHALVMEEFLSEHPELDWSKKYLTDGKYLKKGTIIHHINYIHHDNRIDNLCIFENDAIHKNADKTLNNCFSKLIKLNKIKFKDGKYHMNRNFDDGNFNTLGTKETLKSEPINIYKDISLIKEEIKKIQWKNISNDWTVKYRINKYTPYQTIALNPYKDCLVKNPLYRHKAWVYHLIHYEDFNLTDSRLGEVCGVSRAKIVYWRKRVHNIYSRNKGWGYKRYIQSNGRVWIKMPKDYNNPFTKKQNRYMPEHRYIIEQYLSEHPELNIAKKFLIDGKYLKSSCSIHHVNLDPKSNQLGNLWICNNESQHQEIQSSLLDFTEDLLKAKIITFENGEYKIKVKNKEL